MAQSPLDPSPRLAQPEPEQRAHEAAGKGVLEPDLAARIREEQVAMVYDSTLPALLGNVLVAVLATAIIYPYLPGHTAAIWLTALLLIVAARWRLRRARERQALDTQVPAQIWKRRLLVALGVNGACWGAFSILALNYAGPLTIGFVSFIVGGIIAAAVGTLGWLRPAYLSFTLPAVAGLFGALILRGGSDGLALAAFAVASEIALLGTTWKISEIVSRNISLRLQNEGLVDSLTTANGQLAAVNLSLEHEIEERKRAEARIELLATHDALTGLPNRRMQEERFAAAAARASRTGGAAAVLFVDLDRFKEVNDNLGHPAGDAVLRIFADRLRDVLRASDSVCRHGGDEFLLVIDDADDQARVANLAERVIHSLRAPAEVEGQQVQLGCSIGISLYPNDGENFEQLVSLADKALYQAKRQGRGKYRFFSPEIRLDDSSKWLTRAAS